MLEKNHNLEKQVFSGTHFNNVCINISPHIAIVRVDNTSMQQFSQIKLYILGNQTIVSKILRNAFMTCKVIDFDQK
jgi:hypothetical protein